MSESIDKMNNVLQSVNLQLTDVESATDSSASFPPSTKSVLLLQQTNQVSAQEARPGWNSKPFKLDVPCLMEQICWVGHSK